MWRVVSQETNPRHFYPRLFLWQQDFCSLFFLPEAESKFTIILLMIDIFFMCAIQCYTANKLQETSIPWSLFAFFACHSTTSYGIVFRGQRKVFLLSCFFCACSCKEKKDIKNVTKGKEIYFSSLRSTTKRKCLYSWHNYDEWEKELVTRIKTGLGEETGSLISLSCLLLCCKCTYTFSHSWKVDFVTHSECFQMFPVENEGLNRLS